MPTPYGSTNWEYFEGTSGDEFYDALIYGTKWESSNISFSFPDLNSYFSNDYPQFAWIFTTDDQNNLIWDYFNPLFSEDQEAVQLALSYWSNVANIQFTLVPDNEFSVGDLRFAYGYDGDDSSQAWAYLPFDGSVAGDVWFNLLGTSYSDPWELGSYEFLTAVHEIGHALGLTHTFDGDGIGWPLPQYVDSRSFSTMSYSAVEGNFGTNFTYEPTTPMIFDIGAIQALYGPNLSFNATDTIYTFNENDYYHMTIWDAGGVDTIASNSNSGVVINLNDGIGGGSILGEYIYVENYSDYDLEMDVESPIYNVWIADGVIIENALGGNGPDEIYGNDYDNYLDGGDGDDILADWDGDDILVGGDGNDDLYDEYGINYLYGGSGYDTAFFNNYASNYSYLVEEDVLVIIGPHGYTFLNDVEFLVFLDQEYESAYFFESDISDTTPPTIAITTSDSNLTTGENATITFTLSESSIDFTSDDVTVSGGALSGFSGSGTTYTATFTPDADSTTNGVVSVASTKFTDAAGNANADGSDGNNRVTMTVNTVAVDSTPPTIAITTSDSNLTTGETATITFTLSESSTNFVAGDVTVTGGALSGFSGSGTTYTATFTPDIDTITNGVVSVNNSAFTDAAGNANADGSDSNNTVTMAINTLPLMTNPEGVVVTAIPATDGLRTGTVGYVSDSYEFLAAQGSYSFYILKDGVIVWDLVLNPIGNKLQLPTGIVGNEDGLVYVSYLIPNDGIGKVEAYNFLTNEKLWSKDIGYSAAYLNLDVNGDLYFSNHIAGKTYLSKYDGETGNKLWSVVPVEGDFGAISVKLTSEAIYLAQTDNGHIFKYDLNGQQIWESDPVPGQPELNGAGIRNILEVGNDLFIIRGTENSEYGYHTTVNRVNATTGEIIGTFVYQSEDFGFSSNFAHSVWAVDAVVYENEIILLGELYISEPNLEEYGNSQLLLVSISFDGVVNWAEHFGGPGDDYPAGYSGNSLYVDNNGTITAFGIGENSPSIYGVNLNTSNNFLVFQFQKEPGIFVGTATRDLIYATAGDDVIDSSEGNDLIYAGNGNDTINVGTGDDTVNAGDGNDLIIGGDGAGDDIYNGGDGIDTVRYTSATAAITVNLSTVTGTATSTAGGDAANIGNDTLISIENIIAGNFNDTIIGSSSNNVITGENGNDSINGGEGNDTAVYEGNDTQYIITNNNNGTWTVQDTVSSRDGTDTLTNIEYLQFSNRTLDLSTFAVDTTPPTIVITTSDSNLTTGETATITFTLSESSTDFTSGDVSVSGGALSGFSGSGTTYTATFTPDADSTTNGVVSVASGKFTDAANNPNADGADGNNTVTMTVNTVGGADVTAPTVDTFSPSSSSSQVSIGANIVLNFDEAVQLGSGLITLRSGSSSGAIVEQFDVSNTSRVTVSDLQVTINPSANLNPNTTYYVTIESGAIVDLSGNEYLGTSDYHFSTSVANVVAGNGSNNSITNTLRDDAIDGGSGVDTVTFSERRTDYEIDISGSGYTVHALSGAEGLDTLVNVEKLQFDDMTVDLTMRAQAQTVTPLELQTLQELYVGFFNRVPEANGLSYWISEINEGATLRQVADQFYSAGVQFGVYSADMTEAQFITTVYANVLGRTGESAPDNSEIGYWQNWLHTGTNSKGAMVLQMLNDSHNFFTGDPVVGWVIDLLDNKAAVANYFAVEQGISYNTPEESIARGIEIAAAITPTDITEAITLIGIADEII